MVRERIELVPKLATKPKREIRVRIPRKAGLARFFLRPFGRVLLIGFALITVLWLGVFLYFYVKYARVIDERLRAGVFANSAKIFAAPETVGVGDAATPAEIAAELRRSGYNESRGNPVGYYQVGRDSVEVFPGKDSYFDQEAGLIRFAGGKISEIVSPGQHRTQSLPTRAAAHHQPDGPDPRKAPHGEVP